MEEDSRAPWINWWMILFGVVVLLWSIAAFRDATTYQGRFSAYVSYIPIWIVLCSIIYAGLRPWLGLPGGRHGIRDASAGDMTWVGALYLRAWDLLWREKWLLLFFGGVALLNLLAGMLEALLIWPHASRSPQIMTPSMLWEGLPALVAEKIMASLESLRPDAGLISSLGRVVYSAALVVLLIIFTGRLDSRSDEPESERKVRFLRMVIIPVGIAVLGLSAATAIYHMRWLSDSASGSALLPMPILAMTLLEDAIRWLVLSPLIIGGLIGSLKRSSDGGRIGGDTFISDAVQYFRPLAGLALLLYMFGSVFQLPVLVSFATSEPSVDGWRVVLSRGGYRFGNIVSLLVIFVPYVIVVRGVGTFDGLRSGIRDWMSNAGRVIASLGFGVTVISLLHVFNDTATELLAGQTWSVYVSLPLHVVSSAIVSAIMLVAVWGLYLSITSSDNRVHREQMNARSQ